MLDTTLFESSPTPVSPPSSCALDLSEKETDPKGKAVPETQTLFETAFVDSQKDLAAIPNKSFFGYYNLPISANGSTCTLADAELPKSKTSSPKGPFHGPYKDSDGQDKYSWNMKGVFHLISPEQRWCLWSSYRFMVMVLVFFSGPTLFVMWDDDASKNKGKAILWNILMWTDRRPEDAPSAGPKHMKDEEQPRSFVAGKWKSIHEKGHVNRGDN